ncbi:MAG: hypothetical protein P9L88_02320 [Candidatus Tantalella remota]|nr:hypothetical protein [Candidatus Tantalella remota]
MPDSLPHGIIAFIIPIAWAVILYPFCRKYRLTWIRTLVFVIVASVVAMALKEIVDDKVSVNDIAADLVGLFLGVASLSAILIWGGKRMSKIAVGVFRLKGEVSLRDVLYVALRLEERAAVFVEEAALRLSDEASKKLCSKLALKEHADAEQLSVMVSKWKLKASDGSAINTLEEQTIAHGLYTCPFLTQATEKDILEYAIEMKKLTGDLYGCFINYFPLEWKREILEDLTEKQRNMKKELKDTLANLWK